MINAQLDKTSEKENLNTTIALTRAERIAKKRRLRKIKNRVLAVTSVLTVVLSVSLSVLVAALASRFVLPRMELAESYFDNFFVGVFKSISDADVAALTPPELLSNVVGVSSAVAVGAFLLLVTVVVVGKKLEGSYN